MKRADFPIIERSAPLIDLDVSTDKRTVTAYVATFGNSYPVVDQYGDYDEEIDRSAFNRELGRGFRHVAALFNHGMTVWSTPSERFSMPYGTAIDIRPEAKGLITVTRMANNDLADEILDGYNEGSIKFHSFRGPIYKSAPDVMRSGRTVKRRVALGLKDYGPAPFPANSGAELVAIRSQMLAEQLGEMTPDERRELAALIEESTHLDPAPVASVDDGQPPAPNTVDTSDREPVDGMNTETLSMRNAARRRR